MSSTDSVTNSNSVVSTLQNSSSSKTTGTKLTSSTVTKDEFLTMLVTQLKNQDPMDPMKSDDFAVNLAQFSQLEQLMSINDKIKDSSSSGSSASLASYLGQEVAYNSSTVEVENNDAGRVRFTLGSDAADLKVQLKDSSGAVVETVDLGEVAAGKHTAVLSGLDTSSGEYTLNVVSKGYSGTETNIPCYAAGIVTGFVPGDTPSLIIGNKEVSTSDIVEVNLAGVVKDSTDSSDTKSTAS